MKLIPAIGLAAAGLYVLSKLSFAANASRLNYSLAGMTMTMNGINPVIAMYLIAQNPTNETFQVNAITGTVLLNGTIIGNLAGFVPVTVNPTNQASIPLTVTLSGLSLISYVVGVLNGTAGTQAILRLTGTVNANGTLLPVDVQYQAL
jgi:hypothetical protein